LTSPRARTDVSWRSVAMGTTSLTVRAFVVGRPDGQA
jgi:hypothetical protein